MNFKIKTFFLSLIIIFLNSCSINKYTKVDFSNPPNIETLEKEKIKEVINNNNCVIIRDNWSVPHIYGKTDADAAFGLAYANAQDDFFTIQETVLKARGEYSSVYGAGKNRINAIFDYMVGLLKINDLVNEKYYSDLSPETIELCEAYANGINYFIETNTKKLEQYIYPVSGKDIIAGTVHKTPFFFQLPFFLGDLFEKEPHEIPTHYTIGESIDAMNKVEGSNVYAVSPKLSENHETYLAINSHQPWDGELAWYEAHIHSNEGLNMLGGLFPGSPVVLVGHNDYLGWGHTVNKPDILDIYELEVNPDNENQYKFDGLWKDFEQFEVKIKIKTIGNASLIHKENAYWSIHGPVIKGKKQTYAIRYSKSKDIRMIEQWYKMNKATNIDEWLDAMKIMSIPMFNAGYADKDGNILYIYNASIPERNPDYNWQSVLPGNTSETLWDTYIDFEKLPILINPDNGFIQNCNSSPFQTTLGNSNPKKENYPASYGIETHMTNRAFRALETFAIDDKITYEEFKKYKFDLKYSKHSNMAILTNRALELLSNNVFNFEDIDQNIIINTLSNWNLSTETDNIYAALPIISFGKILDVPTKEISDNKIIELIAKASSFLIQHHNELNVRWGDINRLIRGNVNLELSGGPDVARAIYTRTTDLGELKAVAGDCYVLMVKWNKNGTISSESIHQYGSSTKNSNSKHFDNQTTLFSNEKFKKTSIILDEILENIESIQILN